MASEIAYSCIIFVSIDSFVDNVLCQNIFFKGAFFVLNKAILDFPLYLKFMIDWTK